MLQNKLMKKLLNMACKSESGTQFMEEVDKLPEGEQKQFRGMVLSDVLDNLSVGDVIDAIKANEQEERDE